MAATARSVAPTIIKPRDVVRTSPDARDGLVIEILSGGFRLVRLLGGDCIRIHVSRLYLVHSADPRPWPKDG